MHIYNSGQDTPKSGSLKYIYFPCLVCFSLCIKFKFIKLVLWIKFKLIPMGFFPHCHFENIIRNTNCHPIFQLHELQDRNMECLGMLHESQEEIKELRSRSGPAAHLYFSQPYGVFSGVRN